MLMQHKIQITSAREAHHSPRHFTLRANMWGCEIWKISVQISTYPGNLLDELSHITVRFMGIKGKTRNCWSKPLD